MLKRILKFVENLKISPSIVATAKAELSVRSVEKKKPMSREIICLPTAISNLTDNSSARIAS